MDMQNMTLVPWHASTRPAKKPGVPAILLGVTWKGASGDAKNSRPQMTSVVKM
jgi:hypothetical protein